MNKSIFKRTFYLSVKDFLPHWDAQPEQENVHLVALLSSSQEYQEVLAHFQESFKNGITPKVTNITRIQNPALLGPYVAKKASMKENHNEMRLFHGTNINNIPAINENNFNRSYAGINGKLNIDISYLLQCKKLYVFVVANHSQKLATCARP